MKKLLLSLLCLVQSVLCMAVIPPSIHVEGRDLVDTHGNKVVMHGVMDTPSQWFNSGRWGWGGYDASDAPSKCLTYFNEIYTAITDTTRGTYCTVFRLHLDPCWTNNSAARSKDFTQKDGKWYDPNGTEVGGEADIKDFDMARFKKFWTSVYWKLIEAGMKKGLHIVVRPPGVCPGTIKVGDYYQQYLIKVWSHVASQAKMKQYAGQVSIELANEPVRILNADGSQTANTMHDYFQPIVDAIREQGFTGIIWVPGGTWQQDYRGYATYPITGYNIGYAAHAYVGWYGGGDNNTGENLLKHFLDGVPVVKTNPVIVTEIDWSPEKEGTGHTNESGQWVVANYGTWATGTTSGWGGAFKYAKDVLGNVSMTLTSTDDYINMGKYHDTKGKTLEAAFAEEMKKNGLDPYEGCGQACMDWYKEYYKENRPKPDYANLSDNLSTGTSAYKRFYNPVIAADFPDPDVAKLGDTYYMLSTTFHLTPGATLLKSRDLINWQHCANPLEKLSSADKYQLLNGQNAYAGGMWAGAIEEHNGKLYILLNCNDAGAYVLSTSDPEGNWEVKKLARGYYDPGMIMEGDKIYIACGINHINICELDKDWNFIKETNVIQRDGGLEGSHLYHIGDYYYIYATYGGWPTAQTIFRSTSPTGPYEEHDGMLFDKTINGSANTIHQGALLQTDTGEWWTMLMEDKGAIGRLPSLHPVAWTDGWPVLGKKGVPQPYYDRPTFKSYDPIAMPETNDNFRDYRLGKQWQWNHAAPEGMWSLLERPGYLRLRTSSVVDDMMQARGTLTQRIFAFHKTSSPFGLNTAKPSTGTIALDVAHMESGDMAGIAVQQDPYAMLAVTVDDNGQYSLVWKSGSHTNTDNFTPATATTALPASDDWNGMVFLRAKFDCGNSNSTFYYSLDNSTWTQVGNSIQHRFNLSVFAGVRWAVFNYATVATGGYVDVDWFTTEDTFDESMFFPADFAGYSPEMLTATDVVMPDGETVIMTGVSEAVNVTATFADGHTENVGASCRFTIDNTDIAVAEGGKIKGIIDGTTTAIVTYTDPMGNEFSQEFAIKVSTFPLLEKYVDARMFGSGTFDEATGRLYLTQYGCGGWWFHSGLDLSEYKYVVLKFSKTPPSGLQLHVYDEDNYWAAAADISLSTSKTQKISLKNRKKSSGGATLDDSNIRIFGIWAPSTCNIYLSDVFVSNDGKNPVGIDDIEPELPAEPEGIYNLAGQRITKPTHPGIYIMNGRKVVVK